eukprot:CAMPEP_0118681454 /NCGR_PEP_ID=MMETSP0800-20121206/4952_1 /TAXON_ID=210618 ORGANISM="Striatella unipunctata, Strain CCMP2910" /NCGR_SAMPLE_ID=MMETSP0800 /ASSEMBLY_ACC=CAM_ASM_000638 /LENGTH=539 /DNA_ID=CAMNT_0006577761 /DNA_START=116 /DNA_END=1732 /DNA_ORIENTATION=+
MLKDIREKSEDGVKVISVLTGDFLAPYLLSSIDRGKGMMNALIQTPIDYLTWGNHEADINHKVVCRHVRNFKASGGTFINTNMQNHEAMDCQVPFEILEVGSKKIGLLGLLSDDPNLYKHFKAPGAFGGATILDPWETLAEYKTKLEGEPYNCDLIIPLQHLYVPDDHKTCEMFDVPLVLSGHDHHRVDEIVCGTRLLKPGLDAIYAGVIDLTWNKETKDKPSISACFVKTDIYEPDEELKNVNDKAYDVLAPLRNTELARVPSNFEPLSSVDARGKVTTMGKFVCSLLRSSLNVQRGRQRQFGVDAVMLMGGNIRAGADYEQGSFFSLEALEAEIKSNEVIGIVEMPGWVLADAIEETHAGAPIPGWMQYDSLIEEEFNEDGTSKVTQVGGEPLYRDMVYKVATKIADLTNGQSPTLTKYYKEHPELLPPKGAYKNIHAELMGYFARNMWRKIYESTGDLDLIEKFAAIDVDDDGILSVEDIHFALETKVGLSIHEDETSLAEYVENFADADGDGEVTLADLKEFKKEMEVIYLLDKW